MLFRDGKASIRSALLPVWPHMTLKAVGIDLYDKRDGTANKISYYIF